MARVTVPVLKPLTYQGRSYVRGDMVSMPAIEAAAHARAGDVALGVGVVVPRDVIVEEVPVRTRRRYRRRDMTAEGTSE